MPAKPLPPEWWHTITVGDYRRTIAKQRKKEAEQEYKASYADDELLRQVLAADPWKPRVLECPECNKNSQIAEDDYLCKTCRSTRSS